ncbi:MAG TPA: Crp/Fnr family transcriptional regulator [Cyclobacteriaceae bacterium]
MKKNLEDFIRSRVKNPNDAEVEEILGIFWEKKYNKGELFKERDTIIESLGFLVDGSSRSYFINQSGDEVTDQVLEENNFLSDILSVRTDEKSSIIIEFLEISNVLSAPMDSVKDLLERNITFNILIREYIGDRAMDLLKRHLMFLNGTAKERYQHLLKSNPSLFKKFPLRFIASMIGVTPTQLSRIRKNKY